MTKIAKFKSGEGVEHEVEVGSPAFNLMLKDGSFTRLDEPSADESAGEGELFKIETLPADFPHLVMLHKANIRSVADFIVFAMTANVDGLTALGISESEAEHLIGRAKEMSEALSSKAREHRSQNEINLGGGQLADPKARRVLPEHFPAVKILSAVNIKTYHDLAAFIAEKKKQGLIDLKGIGAKIADEIIALSSEAEKAEVQ